MLRDCITFSRLKTVTAPPVTQQIPPPLLLPPPPPPLLLLLLMIQMPPPALTLTRCSSGQTSPLFSFILHVTHPPAQLYTAAVAAAAAAA